MCQGFLCQQNTSVILLKKYFPHCKKWKTQNQKQKPMKIGKRLETTYCLGDKDYTQNFRPQELKMVNKIRREKYHCVVVGPINQNF